MANAKETTHFGFVDVDEDAKQGMVKDVFARVASSYDLMNDAMSMGIHRAWKDRFIDMLKPEPHMHLLDVAGGTGDIGFRFLRAGGGHVTLTDINESMLREGRSRAVDENITDGVSWTLGNAEAMPCESNSFDAYTIAFGIRNVTHIQKALEEAHRVLKIGGRFMCLEFSHPTTITLDKLYEWYSFNVIPTLGEKLADDRDSYQYLVESIRKFPKQHAFEQMIRDAGFDNVSHTNLSGGIVAIHSGWKL